MTMQKRLVSVALIVALAFGMVSVAPSASAITPWEHFTQTLRQAALDFAHISFNINEFIFPVSGLCTEEELIYARDQYNSWFSSILRTSNVTGSMFDAFFNTHRAVIVEDHTLGARRLKDNSTGEWIVDYNGKYPYVPLDENWDSTPAPDIPGTPEISSRNANRWLELAPIQGRLKSGALSGNTTYNYAQLTDLLEYLQESFPNTNYRLATVFGDSYGVCKNHLILCDPSGAPFLAFKDPASSATNQTFNKIVQDNNGNAVVVQGENVTTEAPIIDQSNLELTIPVTNDNSVSIGEYITQNIYDMTYNFDDHSYTVNTYDVTFNSDNRRYETNYYTWNITYNITNTYVTYIGSNDAYQHKEYEFYYELPDGRSSADLTVDEVAAMSFQFVDCMNYQRSATDSNLRALYHFDGDLSDSSYYSDKNSFNWVEGASITYMDSSVFNGALYLDDTGHKFNINLSKGIASTSDFSIQWRYYQASEPDTQSNIENTLDLSGTTVLKWDERRLYDFAGTQLCLLPIGTWVELALIRHNGTLYLYLNGVKVSALSSAVSTLKQLSFSFGSTSRAYSMLDELRVIDFARVTDGVNYTPTSVPYDSNLVLTLPGSEAAIDDYWRYTSPNNLIKRPLFTDDGDYASLPVSAPLGSPRCVVSTNPKYSYSLDNSCLTVTSLTSSYEPHYTGSSSGSANGFSIVLKDGSTYAPGVTASGSYTFSIVTPSGDVFSHSFSVSGGETYTQFDWGRIYLCYNSRAKWYCIAVCPAPGGSVPISYVELVKGTSSQVQVEHITSAYDLSTLKRNTAAVQTDIPIHGYTVGGVRPTFPVRGDVWFGVTNSRISSVQVYTGSAWTSSNARWWTGERWIPIYAFDIFTLEDCWDIADSDDVITPIESDTAGWNWWKKAWMDFRSWLGGVPGGSGGGTGGGGDYTYPSSYPSPPVDNPSLKDDDGTETTLWDFPGKLFASLWGLLSGLVDVVAGGVGGLFTFIGDGVGGFFGAFSGEDGVFQFFTYGGADIWD